MCRRLGRFGVHSEGEQAPGSPVHMCECISDALRFRVLADFRFRDPPCADGGEFDTICGDVGIREDVGVVSMRGMFFALSDGKRFPSLML